MEIGRTFMKINEILFFMFLKVVFAVHREKKKTRYSAGISVQIVLFQSLSMSLFLNLLFERDSYSNGDLNAKFHFDTAENASLNFAKSYDRVRIEP